MSGEVKRGGFMKDEIEICNSTVIHQDLVDKALKHMPDARIIEGVSTLFKVVGDPTRMKLLLALLQNEMCVCDLSATLSLSMSAISHQLSVLKKLNLVRFRREGKVVFYSLSDDHVSQIMKVGIEHITE